MSERTPRLEMPYIMPSQAQKHVTHNEALRMLDAIVHIHAGQVGLDTPPPEPAEGECHVVGSTPTGSFTGHTSQIAAFQDGAWTFFIPREGWTLWDAGSGTVRVFHDGDWMQAAPPPEQLPHLGIATEADTTNRLAVSAEATLLTHDGAGHQLKLNKASVGDTGTLLFQTGWSGRAEIGLAGNDDFSFKVSSDGSTWKTALKAAAASGAISVENLGVGTDAPLLPLHVAGRAAIGDAINSTRLTSGGAGARTFSLIDTNAMIRIWRRAGLELGAGLEFAVGTASDTISSSSVPWWDIYLQGSPERFSIRRRTGMLSRDFLSVTAAGQVGIGTTSPNTSARLEISASAPGDSAPRGFLPPRMTTAERDTIASLAEGLIIYNTTEKQPQFWDGSQWQGMAA
jgi:hypothetical protein